MTDKVDEQINGILNSYSDAITDTNYEPKRNARPKAKARIEALITQQQHLLLDRVLEEVIGGDIPTDMYGSWTRRKDGTMIRLSDEIIITNNLLDKQRQAIQTIKEGLR